MKIGEFAKTAGVTVKALLHYDRIGLLRPARKTDSGYRVYLEEDFLRLQQITTLRFIGLSLNEIGMVLNEEGRNLERIISIQKSALEEKKKHIESVIAVFDKAENQIKANGFLEAEKLIDIIRMTNMENRVKEQYKTAENLKARVNLHSYNVNKTDWDRWCFDKMQFSDNARILELGCGTGEFWNKNRSGLKSSWNITLSDFSGPMLESTRKTLEKSEYAFEYRELDAQEIPYEDGSFDVVIARHMLYLVPDIDKALLEIRRVLAKDGTFYATTNSCEAMAELNGLVEKFDPKMGLHTNGMCYRFDMENGQALIGKYFNQVTADMLEGKIIVDSAEPVISYKASSIKGKEVLTGKRKDDFTKYMEDYIKEKGSMSITTKAGIFKAKNTEEFC